MQKSINEDNRGLFHRLPEELRYTAVMSAMESAPKTRQSNTAGIERQRAMRQKKEEIAKQEGLEKAEDEYIERLIYHSMWDSDACWKTLSDVNDGLKRLKYKKDKFEALRNNILIRYKGFGWEDWKTPWSKNGRKLSIPDLTKRLKDLFKMHNRNKDPIPEKPDMPTRKRKDGPILGTVSEQRKKLDKKAITDEVTFDRDARLQWQDRELQGIGSLHSHKQQLDAPPLESLIGSRIEYLSEFEMDEAGTVKDTRWCGVVG